MPGATVGPRPLAPRQRTSTHRSRAVSFVAGLLLFQGLLEILVGSIELYSGIESPVFNAWQSTLVGLPVALGCILLVVAVGLWQLRSWAWLVAMSLQGIDLAHALTMYLLGDPDYWSMALTAFIVLALNQAEVREAFGTADA